MWWMPSSRMVVRATISPEPMLRVMTERTVSGPGGRALRVREFGGPAGVPVLAHHGTPGCGAVYERWREDAERRGIRLIGYDRAGYGGDALAPPPPPPDSPAPHPPASGPP